MVAQTVTLKIRGKGINSLHDLKLCLVVQTIILSVDTSNLGLRSSDNIQSTHRGCYVFRDFFLSWAYNRGRQQANGRGDRLLGPPRDGQPGGAQSRLSAVADYRMVAGTHGLTRSMGRIAPTGVSPLTTLTAPCGLRIAQLNGQFSCSRWRVDRLLVAMDRNCCPCSWKIAG